MFRHLYQAYEPGRRANLMLLLSRGTQIPDYVLQGCCGLAAFKSRKQIDNKPPCAASHPASCAIRGEDTKRNLKHVKDRVANLAAATC